MFSLANLSSIRQFLLVTDQLSSPADFYLHQSLANHLKGTPEAKCLVLSVSESISKWKAIAGKSNVNLQHHLASGSLVFVDLLSTAQPVPSTTSHVKSTLRPVLEHIREIISVWRTSGSSEIQVILDDISGLEWIGFSPLDVSRFVRALVASCRNLNTALIVRHHIITPGEPDDLLRQLLQLCTYHLEVLPLSTGKSGAVSGQVALHFGSSTFATSIRPIPRSSAIQYKLTDTACVFFERGTGSTVL
ncbi:hypothetical protein C8Q75DRAFT_723989 [Abortiporus biennis]|nr:hypothetical protein C8Q75DRAFT_723989 [Abortiporus biennis]